MKVDKVFVGDCLDELKKLEDNSVDLVCTDPPYGYSFMGKNWDKAVPSVEIWRECLRVLKPGGFAFVMSAPRQDVLSQMIVRIGEAGFDTDFTSIYWTYASGFPKAANIGKMVDKRAGAEREIVGSRKLLGKARKMKGGNLMVHEDREETDSVNFTLPATPQAKALEGSYGGFQPKPAVEVVIVAMKPLSEKTFVDQALKNGKGVTWLDDCRVPIADAVDFGREQKNFDRMGYQGAKNSEGVRLYKEGGRFPANLLVSDDVLNDGQPRTSGKPNGQKSAFRFDVGEKKKGGDTTWDNSYGDTGSYSRYFDLDAWAKPFPFLICPKASKGEKGGDNKHPTVKPLKLMSYLITLGSRPGDVVLDCFAGSGTTGIAAKNLDRRYILIEREKEYAEIIKARLKAVKPKQMRLVA